MTNKIKISDIVFLDVEASGLGDSCFPIEVGFVRPADMTGWSALIHPTLEWCENGDWDCAAEALHGLSQDRLRNEGADTMDVARALNEQLAGKAVFTDAPDFDRHWLAMLFEETMERPNFELWHAASLIKDCLRRVTIDGPIPVAAVSSEPMPIAQHRAKDDAFALALELWRAIGVQRQPLGWNRPPQQSRQA